MLMVLPFLMGNNGRNMTLGWQPARISPLKCLFIRCNHNGCGSHEGGLALLQVVAFAPRSRFAAETHDEAALVDEVAGDVHGQQEEYERHHQDPRPQHGAHGERGVVLHICRTGDGEKGGVHQLEP